MKFELYVPATYCDIIGSKPQFWDIFVGEEFKPLAQDDEIWYFDEEGRDFTPQKYTVLATEHQFREDFLKTGYEKVFPKHFDMAKRRVYGHDDAAEILRNGLYLANLSRF